MIRRLPLLAPALPSLLLGACLVGACVSPRIARDGAAAAVPPASTFANPLDLDYRFMPSGVSRREAADPMVILHDDTYYLFASKSGGYWYSKDFRAWTLVQPEGLPLEDYAPSVVEIGGRLYYTAHKSQALFTTDDPKAGKWRKVADLAAYADPALFLDDDGRLYLYHGSALNGSIGVVELDPKQGFKVVREVPALMTANHAAHGWERSGADNLGAQMTEGFRLGPYVEGAWMTKHDGTYYLQYAAPGTVWFTYADGVYTSKSPTGPFTYAPYSPFSYKPGGFIGSAGHGGTFRDRDGQYWRVVTMVISVAHKFERRIGLFPAGFDANGVMRTDTYLGDYPQLVPGVARTPLSENRTGWMLLSGAHPATASSTLDGHPVAQAFDEDVRTWWSARSGDAGEWLQVELCATGGEAPLVRALQVNFAEQDTKALGRVAGPHQRWVAEASPDGQQWRTLVDRRKSDADAPHAYVQLEQPVRACRVRITNAHAAAGGRFAIRDLRVFGDGTVSLPPRVEEIVVRRDARDPRTATITWRPAAGARGYVVRYGLAPDELYASYQVGDTTALTTNALNLGVSYWFTVDAFNERGVTRGPAPITTTAAASAPDTLVVGTYAYPGVDRVGAVAPLAARLQASVGRPTRVVALSDPVALADAVRAGRVDVAVTNTFGYLLMASGGEPAASAVATFGVPDGVRTNYGSAIVARAGTVRDLRELAARKGALRVAAVTPGSTTGNLVPRLFLATQGIPELDAHARALTYVGTHARAFAWLRSDSADVAALATEEMDKQLAAGGDTSRYVVLWRSPDVRLGPVAVRATLPAGLRAAIASAVVGLERSDSTAFAALRGGWVEARKATTLVGADDRTYDDVRGLFGRGDDAARLIARFAR